MTYLELYEDALRKLHNSLITLGEFEMMVKPLNREVEAEPTTDAVHGEWVIRENGNKECSVCGHERQDGWDYFCGYCGARMTPYKGGDDE